MKGERGPPMLLLLGVCGDCDDRGVATGYKQAVFGACTGTVVGTDACPSMRIDCRVRDGCK